MKAFLTTVILMKKGVLSAHIIEVTELRKALALLQKRMEELEKENHTLKKIQVRQEKALQCYDNNKSGNTKLMSHHSNDVLEVVKHSLTTSLLPMKARCFI